MPDDYKERIDKDGSIVVYDEDEANKLAEKFRSDSTIRVNRTENKYIFYRIDAITKPMSITDLVRTLETTIKYDYANKIITFLAMITAYTEESQFNLSFRAPSSTGKSYTPLELSTYFPSEDVIKIAYSSPTSFYHDSGEWDKDRKLLIVNLEKKILIFLDQPHDQLLQRLRALLSHDQKELLYKITDKREKSGTRTKNVIIRGFPSVIFCTGSLKIDEQEATRNIILSPEISKEKIREGIELKALKKGNPIVFKEHVEKNLERDILIERIKLIKEAQIKYIIIKNHESVARRFLDKYPKTKARHQRDIERIISLICGLALLNLWHRDRDDQGNIYASEQDINDAFELFDRIADSQELGIAPYVHNVFKQVIKPLYDERNKNTEPKLGLERRVIAAKYFEVFNKAISDKMLKYDILNALEQAGLVYLEDDPKDKRQTLVYVTTPPQKDIYSSSNAGLEKYIHSQGGVNKQENAICENCTKYTICYLSNGRYFCKDCIGNYPQTF